MLLLQRHAGNQAAAATVSGRTGVPVQREPAGKHEKRMMRQPKHPVGKFFAGLGEGALNTTIGPFVNPRFWLGYGRKCDNIWNRNDADGAPLSQNDGDLLYGSAPWRILQIAVETFNQIATATTALALVLSILGAALLPLGGAALISVGGLVGGIATVAHAITFLLRAIATFRDLHAFRKADKGSPIRARLRGKLWADLGGLLGNAIGVVMGGLGGAFQFGGRADAGANVIGDAVNASGLPQTAGAKPGESMSEVLVTGAIGQEGNTLADEMTGIGGMVDDAHGEKADARARARAAQAGPAHVGTAVSGASPSDSSASSVSEVPLGAMESWSSSSSSESESESASSGSVNSAAADEKVALFNESLGIINTLSVGESQKLAKQVTDHDEAKSTSVEMAGKSAELAGESTKLEEKKDTVEAGDQSVAEAASKVKSSTAKEAEAQKALEQTDAAEEAARTKMGIDIPKDAEADTEIETETETEEKVPVQTSAGSRAKAFFRGLATKVLGIPRRIKRLWKKAKAKVMALLLKVTGLDKPAAQLALEMKSAPAEIEGAKSVELATKGTVDDVAAKADDLTKLPTGVG
jgi:hypothetical protein